MKQLGMPWLGMHAFRRTCSSVIIGELKVQPLAQRILRHKDLTTTLRYYTKINMESALGGLNTFEDAVAEGLCNTSDVYATAVVM